MPKIQKPINPTEFDGNFVQEVAPIMRGNRKDRMVQLRCVVCQNLFTAAYHNSKRVRQKACSNQCGGILTRHVKEYRADKHPLYSVWTSLRDRCRNPNNERYSRYGERGIVFSENFNLFDAFLNYVSQLINYPYSQEGKQLKNYSLDRIDVNAGYIEGNLRWADSFTQAANKSWKKPNSTSKYIGVIYCKTNAAWIAKIQSKGKIHNLYYGHSEEEAHEARKKFILDNNLPNIY